MKKNIAIGVLSILCVALSGFTYLKYSESESHLAQAHALLKQAKQIEDKALESEENTTQKAAEARIQARKFHEMAERLKKECKDIK